MEKQIHRNYRYKVSHESNIKRNHRDVVEFLMSDERLEEKGQTKMSMVIEDSKKT